MKKLALQLLTAIFALNMALSVMACSGGGCGKSNNNNNNKNKNTNTNTR